MAAYVPGVHGQGPGAGAVQGPGAVRGSGAAPATSGRSGANSMSNARLPSPNRTLSRPQPEPTNPPLAAPSESEPKADALGKPKNEGKPASGEPSPPAPSSSRASSTSANWFATGADFTWGFRAYAHTESTGGHGVRRYTAAGVAGVLGFAEVYPLASATNAGIARDLGLVARVAAAPGFMSSAPGSLPAAQAPAPVSTRWYALDASLRWRIRTKPGAFGVAVGYGTSIFDFDLTDQADRETPRGRYGMVRIGADAQLRIAGPVKMMGSLAYLHVVSIGSLSTYAPVPSTSPILPDGIGVEGMLGVACEILPALDLSVGARYSGIFYEADTTPSPTGRSASVHDEYLWIATGVRLVL